MVAILTVTELLLPASSGRIDSVLLLTLAVLSVNPGANADADTDADAGVVPSALFATIDKTIVGYSKECIELDELWVPLIRSCNGFSPDHKNLKEDCKTVN